MSRKKIKHRGPKLSTAEKRDRRRTKMSAEAWKQTAQQLEQHRDHLAKMVEEYERRLSAQEQQMQRTVEELVMLRRGLALVLGHASVLDALDVSEPKEGDFVMDCTDTNDMSKDLTRFGVIVRKEDEGFRIHHIDVWQATDIDDFDHLVPVPLVRVGHTLESNPKVASDFYQQLREQAQSSPTEEASV